MKREFKLQGLQRKYQYLIDKNILNFNLYVDSITVSFMFDEILLHFISSLPNKVFGIKLEEELYKIEISSFSIKNHYIYSVWKLKNVNISTPEDIYV